MAATCGGINDNSEPAGTAAAHVEPREDRFDDAALGPRIAAARAALEQRLAERARQIASHEAWLGRLEAARDFLADAEDVLTQGALIEAMSQRIEALRTDRDRAMDDRHALETGLEVLARGARPEPSLARILRSWAPEAPAAQPSTVGFEMPGGPRPFRGLYRARQEREPMHRRIARRLRLAPAVLTVLLLAFLLWPHGPGSPQRSQAGFESAAARPAASARFQSAQANQQRRPAGFVTVGAQPSRAGHRVQPRPEGLLVEQLISRTTGLPPITSILPEALGAAARGPR